MTANTSPIFTLTPNALPAQISTANTNRDGTGTLVDIVTAGANGTRVESLKAVATGTTTAGVIRYYITDAAGANPKLFEERLVIAITPSTTVRVFEDLWVLEKPIILASGQKIKASTHNAETFNIHPIAGDF
jgi:hypothetical protein